MPVHWKFEKGSYLAFIHGLLCVIGTGHTSLFPIWRMVRPDREGDDWKETRESLKKRLEHIGILVRLCESRYTVGQLSNADFRLGWFTSRRRNGLLHHGPPCRREDFALYEGRGILFHRWIYTGHSLMPLGGHCHGVRVA